MTSGPAELPDALLGLIGEWRGEGVGGSPALDSDFRFGQVLLVRRVTTDTLGYASRSWPIATDAPASVGGQLPAEVATSGEEPADWVMQESGFWRWDPASKTVEQVVAVATGVVAVLVGAVRSDPSGGGAHLELSTDLVGHTESASRTPATSVTAERRLYSRRGAVLLYAVDQAVAGHPLAPHASAALHAAPGG